MLQKLLSNKTFFYGLDIIRIVIGGIIISFGLEILNPDQIAGYIEWLTDIGMPFPITMTYIGKLSEIIFGIFLAIGFLTRISSIPLMITMFVVTFVMLDGKIKTGSFYLLLLFACFFSIGSGKISVDYLIEKKKMNNNP